MDLRMNSFFGMVTHRFQMAHTTNVSEDRVSGLDLHQLHIRRQEVSNSNRFVQKPRYRDVLRALIRADGEAHDVLELRQGGQDL
jgi:hypothetical protein